MNEDFLPVLLGTDINAYGVARSLYEEYKIKSIAVGKGRLKVCTNTNILKVEIIEPNIEDDEVFVETMKKLHEKYPDANKLLIPCGDNYAKLIIRNQNKIRKLYKFNVCNEELLKKLDSKTDFYDMCEKYGMSYPKTLTCNKKNYNKIKIDFKYPIIVKPNNSVMYWNCRFENKKKVFILNSYEEYLEATTAVYGSSYTDDLVIQEFIPGDDSKMRVVNAYCNQEGKVKMISLGKVLLEEYTPEGIGSYAAIISGYDKKIYDMIINFLEKINYKGYANFDMKFDTRDNEYKLFELNPRQGRSSYFVSAGGVNLIKPLVDDVIYNKDPKIVYGKDEALYTIIPKGVILKYTSDKELKEKAKKLYKEKKYSDGYYFDGDANLKRKMAFKANQLNYFKKYAKYYKEKK